MIIMQFYEILFSVLCRLLTNNPNQQLKDESNTEEKDGFHLTISLHSSSVNCRKSDDMINDYFSCVYLSFATAADVSRENIFV